MKGKKNFRRLQLSSGKFSGNVVGFREVGFLVTSRATAINYTTPPTLSHTLRECKSMIQSVVRRLYQVPREPVWSFPFLLHSFAMFQCREAVSLGDEWTLKD